MEPESQSRWGTAKPILAHLLFSISSAFLIVGIIGSAIQSTCFYCFSIETMYTESFGSSDKALSASASTILYTSAALLCAAFVTQHSHYFLLSFFVVCTVGLILIGVTIKETGSTAVSAKRTYFITNFYNGSIESYFKAYFPCIGLESDYPSCNLTIGASGNLCCDTAIDEYLKLAISTPNKWMTAFAWTSGASVTFVILVSIALCDRQVLLGFKM